MRQSTLRGQPRITTVSSPSADLTRCVKPPTPSSHCTQIYIAPASVVDDIPRRKTRARSIWQGVSVRVPALPRTLRGQTDLPERPPPSPPALVKLQVSVCWPPRRSASSPCTIHSRSISIACESNVLHTERRPRYTMPRQLPSSWRRDAFWLPRARHIDIDTDTKDSRNAYCGARLRRPWSPRCPRAAISPFPPTSVRVSIAMSRRASRYSRVRSRAVASCRCVF